jgi:hypothetical protein
LKFFINIFHLDYLNGTIPLAHASNHKFREFGSTGLSGLTGSTLKQGPCEFTQSYKFMSKETQ